MAVRISQRLGFHRDGTQLRLRPFEIEERRRAWWNLVALDKRIAELSGNTVSACASDQVNCERPLNINDADIYPDSKIALVASEGPTEMAFALARYELVATSPPDAIPHLPSRGQPCDSQPGNLPTILRFDAGYCNFVESAHIMPYNPEIPLHRFTMLTTRQSLYKRHIVRNLHVITTSRDSVPRGDLSWLLDQAIQMIEADNDLQTAQGCNGFLWYTQVNSPFPAYMFFAIELRLVDDLAISHRAWKVLEENYKCRGLMRAFRPPTHVAFAECFLEAWDVYEDACKACHRNVNVPTLILELRRLVQAATGKKASRTSIRTEGVPTHEGTTFDPLDALLDFTAFMSDPLQGEWALLFPQQSMYDPMMQ